MATNFPNTPAVNDLHTVNGKTYKWDGTVWRAYVGTNSIQGLQGLQGIQGIQSLQGIQGIQGFADIPQNSQSTSYTLALTDVGKHVAISSGNITIPANSSIAFAIGSAVTIFRNAGSSCTIAITTDTLRWAGTATTGTRTLAQYGVATLLKVASTTWVISGTGLT